MLSQMTVFSLALDLIESKLFAGSIFYSRKMMLSQRCVPFFDVLNRAVHAGVGSRNAVIKTTNTGKHSDEIGQLELSLFAQFAFVSLHLFSSHFGKTCGRGCTLTWAAQVLYSLL